MERHAEPREPAGAGGRGRAAAGSPGGRHPSSPLLHGKTSASASSQRPEWPYCFPMGFVRSWVLSSLLPSSPALPTPGQGVITGLLCLVVGWSVALFIGRLGSQPSPAPPLGFPSTAVLLGFDLWSAEQVMRGHAAPNGPHHLSEEGPGAPPSSPLGPCGLAPVWRRPLRSRPRGWGCLGRHTCPPQRHEAVILSA